MRSKVTVGLHDIIVFCWRAKDPIDGKKFENVGGEDCLLYYICVDAEGHLDGLEYSLLGTEILKMIYCIMVRRSQGSTESLVGLTSRLSFQVLYLLHSSRQERPPHQWYGLLHNIKVTRRKRTSSSRSCTRLRLEVLKPSFVQPIPPFTRIIKCGRNLAPWARSGGLVTACAYA